jgi:RNA recognition motif-containing protein
VRIVTCSQTGSSKGFGYIEFTTIENSARALKGRNGYELDGQDIRVQFVSPCSNGGHDFQEEQNGQVANLEATKVSKDLDNGSGNSSPDSDDSDNCSDSSSDAPQPAMCDHRVDCSHFSGSQKSKFLIDLYLLADKLIDPVTANIVMDEFVAFTQDEKSYPDYDLIDFVYNSTAYTSPLRKLIRDGYIHSVDYNWVDDLDKQRLQVDFIHDLVREVWTLNRDNIDKTVREVYESDYMQHSGDRYHQPVGESA